MEGDQEQFTRRMLRRASLKKDGDEATNFTSLRRRLSILQAIEDSRLHNGKVFDSEVSNAKEEKSAKKEVKPKVVRTSNGAVKKSDFSVLNSWTKKQMPLLESFQSSTLRNHESEQDPLEGNTKHVEQRDEKLLIKDIRFHETKSTSFQKLEPLKSTSDSNKIEIKEEILSFLQNLQNDDAIEKNINNIFPKKINTGTYNLSNQAECVKTNFNFAKNDLTDTKTDLNIPKSDLTFPKPYQGNDTKMYKSMLNDIKTSNNDESLSTYMKGFQLGEVKWRGPLSNVVSKKRNSRIEDWKDTSDIFGKSLHDAMAPQVLTVGYKTIPAPETVTEFKILDHDSKIKESFLHDQNSSEKLDETVTESGSMFSLTSAINNLDEEIRNLEMRPDAQNLVNLIETPKKLLPMINLEKPSVYTPRKLFNQNFSNENKELEKPEYSEKKIGIKETCSEGIRSNLVRRSSSIFGFKTPKSWRPKPNLESTRKASNFDLTKKTTSPSQIGSTLSTISPNTPRSPEDVENKPPNILENTIPFEVEQFLEDALGDELYSTSITYALSELRDGTNSNLNASELISEDKTPPRGNYLPKTPKTEPSKHSTLNRTVTAYKSLSQRIKKRFRPSIKESVKQSWNPYVPVSRRLDDRLQRILEDLNIQQTMIYQASKALDFCRSVKEFVGSHEQVESERLLLVANLRKLSLFQEIKSIASKTQTESSYRERAEVTIKNFSLCLKEEVWRRERQSGEIVEWFVIVISQGITVWATRTIACPINSPRIYFPGALSIPNLTPNFTINLKVYSLKLHSVTYDHEEKYHIPRTTKHLSCPSPTKLLKRSERTLSPKSYEVKFSGFRESSFVLVGNVDFHLHDLGFFSPWPLRSVPKDSVLQGTINLDLACRLHLSISHAGFLTHGDEVGGFAVWNRRWCVLEGHTLMFWNYPREEEIKSPLLMIDLMDCVSSQVNTIDRTLCARPRTFVIETARRRNLSDRDSIVLECRQACTIIRHLLQCDTIHDMIEWMTKLNHILSALHEWNVIKTKPKPHESDL